MPSLCLFVSCVCPSLQVFRHSGLIEPDDLIRQLLLRMEAHQQIAQTMTQEKNVQQKQRDQTRSLREQQDLEYQESLIMDQTLVSRKAGTNEREKNLFRSILVLIIFLFPFFFPLCVLTERGTAA